VVFAKQEGGGGEHDSWRGREREKVMGLGRVEAKNSRSCGLFVQKKHQQKEEVTIFLTVCFLKEESEKGSHFAEGRNINFSFRPAPERL